MSHFYGVIRVSSATEIDIVFDNMQDRMSFFNADARYSFVSENCIFCNSLLFTTPEAANLTGICSNERYVLAATCRLDNRHELAAKLSLQEHQSDHEYLLAAYVKYGNDCPLHLLGDFSFVVWDTQQQTLFMCKDHLGIKPLFYFQDENVLLFSTSVQALKVFPQPLNEKYVASELKNFPQGVEDTFFKNIHRFLPAHKALFDVKRSHFEQERYWDLRPIDLSAFNNKEALYQELDARFKEAVRCRTRTLKKIGCQLSGGLDSSAVAVLLSRQLPLSRLHTYSFVLSDETRAYSENKIDEQNTQQAIIEYAGLLPQNHHQITGAHFKNVFEQLDRTSLVMGGFANSDCIWQDSLFKKAAEDGVGFIMSGFPGDECVSINGGNYFYDYIGGGLQLKKLVSFILKNPYRASRSIAGYVVSRISGTYKRGYKKIQKKRNLLKSGSNWQKELKDTSFAFTTTFKAHLKEKILRAHTSLRAESEGAYAITHGIETVYPLADIRLIELVYSLPTEMFVPHPLTRMLFRNMCKGILPDEVRLQPKFNGAMTLAFAEYWKKKQWAELKALQLQDRLGLMDTSKVAASNTFEETNRLLVMYQLDYHICKNQ